jgi:hypothetical protein
VDSGKVDTILDGGPAAAHHMLQRYCNSIGLANAVFNVRTLGLKEFCFRSGGGAFDALVAHVRSVARRDGDDDVDTQGPPRPFYPFTRCKSNIAECPVMYTTKLHV